MFRLDKRRTKNVGYGFSEGLIEFLCADRFPAGNDEAEVRPEASTLPRGVLKRPFSKTVFVNHCYNEM